MLVFTGSPVGVVNGMIFTALMSGPKQDRNLSIEF